MKQALTEALALWDSAPDWNDSNTTPKEWQVAYSLFAAAARLVERLLPGECGNCKGTGGLWSGGEEMPQFSTCPACHGSGRVWDEGIVEAVAKALSASLFDDWDGLSENLKGEYRKQAVAVLSALVELLTEKVEK